VSKLLQIGVLEPSLIIVEGLQSVLMKWGLNCRLTRIESLDDVNDSILKYSFHLVCVNPSIVQHRAKYFQSVKCQSVDVRWVGIVYAYFDQQVLSLFDAIISVSDSPESIVSTLQKLILEESRDTEQIYDVLSDREIDVLSLLARGLSNKEVADKLNISVNTAITHRKNISQKTGIKSVSGLTIYAVVKKIITLDDVSDIKGGN
jgi:DNA-binding CsgD family transcriptional regulator